MTKKLSGDAISCPPRDFNVAGAGKQTIKLGSKSENLIFVIFKLPPMLVGIKINRYEEFF